jgi:hypothetical protein
VEYCAAVPLALKNIADVGPSAMHSGRFQASCMACSPWVPLFMYYTRVFLLCKVGKFSFEPSGLALGGGL